MRKEGLLEPAGGKARGALTGSPCGVPGTFFSLRVIRARGLVASRNRSRGTCPASWPAGRRPSSNWPHRDRGRSRPVFRDRRAGRPWAAALRRRGLNPSGCPALARTRHPTLRGPVDGRANTPGSNATEMCRVRYPTPPDTSSRHLWSRRRCRVVSGALPDTRRWCRCRRPSPASPTRNATGGCPWRFRSRPC